MKPKLNVLVSFTFMPLVFALASCSAKTNQGSDTSPINQQDKDAYTSAINRYQTSQYASANEFIDVILNSKENSLYKDSARALKIIIDRLIQSRDSIESAQLEMDRKAAALRGEAALKKMKIKKDEFREITWYQDKTSPNYVDVNGIYGYVGIEGNSSPMLRLKIQYAADDWLFIEGYIIKVDDLTFNITESGYDEVQRDNDSGIWEWLDRIAGPEEKEMMKAVAYGKNPKIRYIGKQYYKDRIITTQQQQALRNVLDVYTSFGGTL